ncbi:MAG: ribosome-inactivating family protein [Rubrivivax sp.]
MIDDGILFDYKNDQTYVASLNRVRARLAVPHGNYLVLGDRISGGMRRFAIAIFDERGSADIDVCMLGNTMYILGTRLAEQKWFVTAKQPREFSGCDGSILMTLPFEGGYGELGIIGAQGLDRFTRSQASAHVAAMKDGMRAYAAGGAVSADVERRCKLAFAFFAMTIAEAARFTAVETMMLHGGIDPPRVIPLLQSWVVKSSVCDASFPAVDIAVAGIHEQRSGKVWPLILDNLVKNPNDCPTVDDLAGTCVATRAFLGKTGAFEGSDTLGSAARKRGEKSGWQSGYEFLLDAYFRSRLDAQLIVRARAEFARLAGGAKPSAQHFKGLKL